jgi:hypothetical protein
MSRSSQAVVVAVLALCVASLAQTNAQQKKTGVLAADEVSKVVPSSYFFDDQVAPVQMRNAVAIRTTDGKIISAGLVDSSGYASAIAEKYQGFLITSKPLSLDGKKLAPGQYGFGFTNDGKFRVMDVAANEVMLVDAHVDQKLQRAVPLKAVADGPNFRLYAGRKYVVLKLQ